MKNQPKTSDRIIASTDGLRAPHGTISNCIKQLRSQHGWSQHELARRCNVSPVAVELWELGRCCPSLDSVTTLAITFSVPVDFLLAHPRSAFDKRPWGRRKAKPRVKAEV